MSLEQFAAPVQSPRAPHARRSPLIAAPIASQPNQQDLEKLLKIIDRYFQPSTWEFVTSAGVEVSVNPVPALPVSIGIGLSLFWVKETLSTNEYKLTFTGYGPGIGWGPIPASATGSIPQMPSQGIGKIRRGPLAAKKLVREDFDGPCAVVEYGAGLAEGGSLYIIFFGASPLLLRLLSANGPFSDALVTAASSRAVGLLLSTSVGLQAGVGATVYNGSVT